MGNVSTTLISMSLTAYFFIKKGSVFEMVVRGKQELRNIFRNGAIPTEQNFTDFIDSYIASINGNIPNAEGNIEVPVAFNVNPGLTPMQLPSTYPVGRTIGVFDYVRGSDPQTDTLLAPFNLQDGRLTIITDNFDSSGIIIQQIDTFKNGAFVPSITRTSLEGQNAWGQLFAITNVTSINGQSPDANGNIVVSAERGEKGEKGDQGEIGPQGIIGIQGIQGQRGLQGERGEQGERGQGLEISNSYATLALANADITNIQDSKFVYISNDENNENRGTIYFKHIGATTLEFQFIAEGIKGDKGDTGERGIQGVQGLQGESGPRGLQGIQGEPGQQGTIGIQGVQGRQGETGPRGLQGEKGDKGDQGERGLQGIQGLTGATGLTGPSGATTADATTTTKGLIQVGNGLSVVSGNVSVTPKEFLTVVRQTTNQDITVSGTNLIFNRLINGNIPYNTTNGGFTLTGGKTYRITVTPEWVFSGTVGFIDITLGNLTGTAIYTNYWSRFTPVTSTANESTQGPFDIIHNPVTTGIFAIYTSSVQSVTGQLKSNSSQLVIQEI